MRDVSVVLRDRDRPLVYTVDERTQVLWRMGQDVAAGKGVDFEDVKGIRMFFAPGEIQGFAYGGFYEIG